MREPRDEPNGEAAFPPEKRTLTKKMLARSSPSQFSRTTPLDRPCPSLVDSPQQIEPGELHKRDWLAII
jgi:hypothetical protein